MSASQTDEVGRHCLPSLLVAPATANKAILTHVLLANLALLEDAGIPPSAFPEHFQQELATLQASTPSLRPLIAARTGQQPIVPAGGSDLSITSWITIEVRVACRNCACLRNCRLNSVLTLACGRERETCSWAWSRRSSMPRNSSR
jgi:hypothetical protein